MLLIHILQHFQSPSLPFLLLLFESAESFLFLKSHPFFIIHSPSLLFFLKEKVIVDNLYLFILVHVKLRKFLQIIG